MAPLPPLRLLVATLLVVSTAALTVSGAPVSPAAAQTSAGEDPPSEDTVDEPPPVPIREVVFPVAGSVTYTDTFGACRGYRCYRAHQGADLFGPKLLPLVAAADGEVSFMRRSATGTAGNTVIITDDEGWRYVYLHLNNDTPGTDDGANPQAWIAPNRLQLGDRVSAGQVIGYLGDSGNAERTPDHLHFEIKPPGQRAINPTASLRAAEEAGRVVSASSLSSTAGTRAEHVELVGRWYRALLLREPTEAELLAWSDRFAIGFADEADLIADLTMAPPRRDAAGAVYRSYHIAFGRRAELAGFRVMLGVYEAGEQADGEGTEAVISKVLASPEWTSLHGTQTDAEFIDTFYRKARGFAPAERTREYWLEQLTEGRSRASLAAYFVDSYQVKNNTWHALEVTQAYRAALDRLPTAEEYDLWVDHLDDGGLIEDVVASIRD